MEQGGIQIPRPAGSRERSAMVYVYAYGASSRTGRSLFARKEYQAAGVAVLAFDIFAGKPSPWSSTQVKTICTIGICKGGRIHVESSLSGFANHIRYCFCVRRSGRSAAGLQWQAARHALASLPSRD